MTLKPVSGMRARPGSWNISDGCFQHRLQQFSYLHGLTWLLDKDEFFLLSSQHCPPKQQELVVTGKAQIPSSLRGLRVTTTDFLSLLMELSLGTVIL